MSESRDGLKQQEGKNLLKLKEAMSLLCNASNSKEEAFLNGYLMAKGHEQFVLDNVYPSLSLVAENPKIFIPIELDIKRLYKKLLERDIKKAKELLREIYARDKRNIPKWLSGE